MQRGIIEELHSREKGLGMVVSVDHGATLDTISVMIRGDMN